MTGSRTPTDVRCSVPAVLEAVIIGLVTTQIAFVVTTVYLHRALAHRAIKLKPPWPLPAGSSSGLRRGPGLGNGWPCTVSTTPSRTRTVIPTPGRLRLLGGPIRQCHSLPEGTATKSPWPATPRSPRRSLGQLLFDHALLGLAIGMAILVGLFGWEVGLIAAGVHATAYILGGGAINAIGHKWGKRPHDNLATNNQWLAWLVAGEGLHNNHHAATTSSRMSMAEGEIDPGWWAVRVLVLLRLATLRHGTAAAAPSRV